MNTEDLKFLVMAHKHLNDPKLRYAFTTNRNHVERILSIRKKYGKKGIDKVVNIIKEIVNEKNI